MSTTVRDPRVTFFRIAVLVVILGAVGAIAWYRSVQKNAPPDKRGELAQCLTDKGVKMYGAYWCPHCQAQKKAFGKGFSDVTYVECAAPGNPQAQTQACIDAEIKSYPTWEFPGGDRVTGERSLKELAEKAQCAWEEPAK